MKCNKDYKEPLILSNGSFVCPKCFKKFHEIQEFKFNEENKEYYELSQIAFFKGLKENNEAYINQSIEYAREAYMMGNPNGLLHLGYCYDKDFVEKDKTEKYRTQIAYEYYSMIAYSKQDNNDFAIAGEFNQIKTKAAKLLLEMLANYQEKSTEERYTVDYNYDRLKAIIPDLTKPSINIINKTKSIKNKVLEYIVSRGSGKPLVSIYKMKNFELKEILEDQVFKNNLKKISIRYYRSDTSSLSAISFENQLEEALEVSNSELNAYTYIVLYNNKYNYRYLKYFGRKKFASLLLENNSSIIRLMDNFMPNELFIYEDDIYYVSKGGKINARTIEKLTNFIIKGE